ncbi:MAG: transcriptional regulator [Desulfobacterales bacterium CG07_land_8_20_14_0_80_52_14]|nr:MAG: transcriptional regulator [Desulfobacterales bacterium CG23_combo_of_CG06-09_8_20_14_all_52_9]PIU50308.1 MAG: transcriptional regulator [Desulfobacterales bacterium CG07_land_8_20_14_0_80_52_14]
MDQIFVSSVQKELQAERYAVRDFVHGNDLLRQFFRVFLFEDLPPSDRRPDDVYLDEVAKSSVYLGIFGDEYGWEDDDGFSPTEKEFNIAARHQKRRLILIKGREDKKRDPKMRALIRRAGDELVRRRFEDTDELLRLVYGSLIQFLQDRGFIAARDFDAAACEGASMNDISAAHIRRFIERARNERKYALPVDTPPAEALAHLNLLTGAVPSRGAILLFCDQPERFMPSAEVTCLHFHGTEVAKPIPSQQVYRGAVFDIADKAVDFVMGCLARRVEPGSSSVASDVTYEIPHGAVREAVVNAVAHRNYASKAAVQVMVFADRIEVWNPGGLPENLTVDQLRRPHHSVPRNRLLCEPLFLAHYIERAGTGTLDMIRLCREAGLPEPEFHHEGERFVVIIRRDWLTAEAMVKLGLSDRQRKGVAILRAEGRLTSGRYQEETGASRQTASRDLDEMMNKGVLERHGERKGTFYTKAKVMPQL